jgi:thiol:disulfide interchange protein DsbD
MRFNRQRAVTEAGRAAALVVACVGVALAASRHVQASLVAEHESIRAGEPFWVGLRLKMEPGWHTYWKNPGDAGLPTRVKWTLPEGFEAGPIDWPYPRPFSQGPVTSYGYEDEVLLPVPITPPPSLTPGKPVTLAARVDWLECQEACVPGRADLSLTLPVTAGAPRAAAEAGGFADARRRLPAAPSGWTFQAAEKGGAIELVMRPPRTGGRCGRRISSRRSRPSSIMRLPRRWRAPPPPIGWRSPRRPTPDGSPARLKGVLVVHDPEGKARALRVDAPVANKGAGGVAPQAMEER